MTRFVYEVFISQLLSLFVPYLLTYLLTSWLVSNCVFNLATSLDYAKNK